MKPPLATVFQPLITVFDAILKVFHDDVGMSWGLAIIALTVLIRCLLLPLTLKQARSISRIAHLSPEIKNLRLQHGADPQRLQHETMTFYRAHKINPLAPLLPTVAQLPVFLALYYTLRTDLRHDICQASTLRARQPRTRAAKRRHRTSSSSPTSRAGPRAPALVALIALYVGSQLLSFLTSANPTTDTTQRRLLLALPFVFVSIAWQLPAGLLLYWITTNAWTIGQGAIVRKRLGPPQQAATGRGGRLGDLFNSCSPVTGTSHRFPAADHAAAATRQPTSPPARARAAGSPAREPLATSRAPTPPRRRRPASQRSARAAAGEQTNSIRPRGGSLQDRATTRCDALLRATACPLADLTGAVPVRGTPAGTPPA